MKTPFTHHELDFLPAALEIQERPPSPIGRAILWSVIGFFIIALAWSIIGRVDIVATAQGKIIPSGRVKVIQPLELGVVRAIHVVEGQQVEQGDVLIELDSTLNLADRNRLNNELHAAQLNRARLATLTQHLQDPSSQHAATRPQSADPEIDSTAFSFATPSSLALQQRLLHNQWREYQARLAAQDAEIASREAELAATRAQANKLQQTLPIVSKRAQAIKDLVDKQLAAENTWLELEQQRIEQRQDLASHRQRMIELTAAMRAAEETRASIEAEFIAKALTELAETERQLSSLQQEVIKAEQRTGLQTLTAPIAGVVQQLGVHTLGGVVTPAQELLKVVPREDKLEVEAWMLNKDIGFVQEGQRAEIKVETFPFTQYGSLAAQVIDVSNDAINDEEKGLLYAARVQMFDTRIHVGDKQVKLTPGMAVTVEIKTGTRRLIEFVLSPLLKYRDEGLRER